MQVQAAPGRQAYTSPSKMTLHGHLPAAPPQNAQLFMAITDHMLFPLLQGSKKMHTFLFSKMRSREKEEI